MTSRTMLILLLLHSTSVLATEPDFVIDLWPGKPPGPERTVGQEGDTTTERSNLVANRRVIRLGNVSIPQAHVYLPPEAARTGSCVVVCPGGGFSILAWDLEGTEVAEWLNSLGVTAVVVKYRVPTRNVKSKWLQPTQDTQRAISIVRSRAKEWAIDGSRIGVLGFSAGGHTAARTALATERLYTSVDDHDQQSCIPDSQILIYPAYLSHDENTRLAEGLNVTKDSPPAFVVHAFDDQVPVEGSLLLMLALKRANVPSEIHVYDAGGHGYGLRQVASQPVTGWAHRCEAWLKRNLWLSQTSR